MSKAVSKLNALCDALSRMRKSTALNVMYRHSCNPGTGTVDVLYVTNPFDEIYCVHFIYTTWIGARSELFINTTKPY